MLRTMDRYEGNIQTERSSTELIEHGSSFVPLRDSDRLSYNWILISSQQLALQKEETGKEKLRKIHKKMVQEIQEKVEPQDNPIDRMSSILGRIKISHRKLVKVIFESQT